MGIYLLFKGIHCIKTNDTEKEKKSKDETQNEKCHEQICQKYSRKVEITCMAPTQENRNVLLKITSRN